MAKFGEKIVQYLYKALGEQNFVDFVKLLVNEGIMSEADFNNLKRVFQKKKKKKPSRRNFKQFLKQQKMKNKAGNQNENDRGFVVMVPEGGKKKVRNGLGNGMMNQEFPCNTGNGAFGQN